jgi:hypothetical protein
MLRLDLTPDGLPMPVRPEGIDALLEVCSVLEALQASYMAKDLAAGCEKERLRASPNGTCVGSTDTARPVGKRARTARAT